jgi:hypothetical protein
MLPPSTTNRGLSRRSGTMSVLSYVAPPRYSSYATLYGAFEHLLPAFARVLLQSLAGPGNSFEKPIVSCAALSSAGAPSCRRSPRRFCHGSRRPNGACTGRLWRTSSFRPTAWQSRSMLRTPVTIPRASCTPLRSWLFRQPSLSLPRLPLHASNRWSFSRVAIP